MTRQWLKNFLLLTGTGFVFGFVRHFPDDLPLPALLAVGWLVADKFDNPSPGQYVFLTALGAFLTLTLLVLSVCSPARLAVESSGVFFPRSAPFYLLLAFGGAILTFVSWTKETNQ